MRFTLDLFKAAGWTVEGVALAVKGKGGFPIEYELVDLDILLQVADVQAWMEERYGEAVWSEFYQRPMWFCRTK